ncbi:BTAD domain-containing putative transcriptional regulator [Spongiactinospora sp. 9N601]
MRFGVLGPLTIDDNGIGRLPSAPKQRQLLALFLMNAGHFVPASACIEELWGSGPPRTVTATLQTYILQIRRSLAMSPEIGSVAQARKVLITGNRGYHLIVPADSLDVMEFRRWLRDGRRAALRNDDETRARCLRMALAQWRGPALGDVPVGPRLRPEVERLEESRIAAMQECFDAELRLGRHQDILGELRTTAARHPFNEEFQAQYMLALYRSGQQVKALDVFHRLRATLAAELGLGPSRTIRSLHEAMVHAHHELSLEVIGA